MLNCYSDDVEDYDECMDAQYEQAEIQYDMMRDDCLFVTSQKEAQELYDRWGSICLKYINPKYLTDLKLEII